MSRMIQYGYKTDCNTAVKEITALCSSVNASEKLLVYGFGAENGLSLRIFKDRLFDHEKDEHNSVDVLTYQNGQIIDRLENVRTDNTLIQELTRIWGMAA